VETARPATDSVIEAHGLVKVLGRRRVVDGLDLAVPAGSIFGFLGPNGSGKTTTIRMLVGLIHPDGGTLRVLGHPIPSAAGTVLPRVGAVVESPAFYPFLTGWQNLERLDVVGPGSSAVDRRERIGSALERVGLADAARRRYRTYSLGMRQRLAIAAALVRPVDLLILDEPTNGLDPQGTREVRNLLRGLSTQATVFLSTHLLAEVEQVCTHAAVVSKGKVVAQGPLEELRARARRPTLAVGSPSSEQAAALLSAMPGVGAVVVEGEVVRAELGTAKPEDVNVALVRAGIPVRSLTTELASLEEAFVGLTGEGFDVGE